MSSAKKLKNQPKKEPMFDIDPSTGRFISLPLNWGPGVPIASGNSIVSRSSENKRMTRIFSEIRPLTITAADLEEMSERDAKIRRKDTNSVRKGLFNYSAKKESQTRRTSINKRRTSISRKIVNKPQPKKFNPTEMSPLLNMEEVEEELLNKKGSLRGYPFKSPHNPNLKFAKNNINPFSKKVKVPSVIVEEPALIEEVPKMSVDQTINVEEPKTPDSSSSNEFLKFEQLFCEAPGKGNNYIESPVSSVCNMLEETGLDSVKKFKIHSSVNLAIVADIESIIENEIISFKQLEDNHKNRMIMLTKILDDIKTKIPQETECKENVPLQNHRRSARLQNKSPLPTKNNKLLVSPVVMKSGDLRKSTLKKNLASRNLQYQNQSPRTRNALTLYNSIRLDHSILQTPRLERKSLLEPPKSLSRYLISSKVQSQCMLLQNTPIHK